MLRGFVLVWVPLHLATSLDNGVARTPPMGWLSWERFACEVDCDDNPENCISSRLYKDMADRMVADGWKDAGYEYVNVDDCWPAASRDSAGLLQADEKRFPGGIRALCDYIHSKGLKCGLYTDIGETTCGSYLALNVTDDLGNTQFVRDVQNFASWGIDSLKVDGCNQPTKVMSVTYPRLSKALLATGRPILYSCSWPAYVSIPGGDISPETYKSLEANCNMWRNWDDIVDTWTSVKSIVKWWHDHQEALVAAAGPGHWNDPDMILAGNTGLSISEYEAQFAFWSLFAAPLLMSNDLRAADAQTMSLLQNPDVIAVNQDSLGKQGRCISGSMDSVSAWARPLAGGDVAVLLFNGNAGVPGLPRNISVNAQDVGIHVNFSAYDLLARRPVGGWRPTVFAGGYTWEVPANSVHFVRLKPVSMQVDIVV